MSEVSVVGGGPVAGLIVIVRGVWLFSSVAADVAIDISHSFERKLAARLAHVSQTSNRPPSPKDGTPAQVGAVAGVPLAETFTVLELD